MHIDKKIDIATYISALGNAAQNCNIIENIEVFWGAYSMVDAELRLLTAARTTGNYEKFLLLTDDSTPIYPPSTLHASLSQDLDFVTAMAQPAGSKNDINYKKFFFLDHRATAVRGRSAEPIAIDDRFIASIFEIAALKAFGKKNINIAYGSAYWALRAETVDRLLAIIDNDPHLTKSFVYSSLPDEIMMQSIILNYISKRNLDLSPMYADFHSQDGGPRVINSIAGLPYDLNKHQLFVRKISADAIQFIDVVSARLLADLNAWGTNSTPARPSAPAFYDEVGTLSAVSTYELAAPQRGEVAETWHGVESYSDRTFRWTAAKEITWSLSFGRSAPGIIRFFVPVVIAKGEETEKAQLMFLGQAKGMRWTRHSLIAEFEHDGFSVGEQVTLLLPPPQMAAPPWDERFLGLGIAVGNEQNG